MDWMTCRRTFSGRLAVLATTASATCCKISSFELLPAIWPSNSSAELLALLAGAGAGAIGFCRMGLTCSTGATGAAGGAGATGGTAAHGSTGAAGAGTGAGAAGAGSGAGCTDGTAGAGCTGCAEATFWAGEFSGGIIRVALPGFASSSSHEGAAGAGAGAAGAGAPLVPAPGSCWIVVGWSTTGCGIIMVGCAGMEACAEGCTGGCGPCGCAGWAEADVADLFTTWVLSASLRMPVSQSGRSPAELFVVGAMLVEGGGNCVDAGGGT